MKSNLPNVAPGVTTITLPMPWELETVNVHLIELDAGFLRDGGYAAGLEIETLFSEPFIAVLPKKHPLARYKTIEAISSGRPTRGIV